MRPRREHLEISPSALRDYLHGTVRAIARPTPESEPIRLVRSGAAKEHALHAARYEHAKPRVVIGVTHGNQSSAQHMGVIHGVYPCHAERSEASRARERAAKPATQNRLQPLIGL